MSLASCLASRSTSPSGTMYRASRGGAIEPGVVDDVVELAAPAAVVDGTEGASGSPPAPGGGADRETRRTTAIRPATPMAANPNGRRNTAPCVTDATLDGTGARVVAVRTVPDRSLLPGGLKRRLREYRRDMDPIRRFFKPELRSPRAILAWEGWNDACEAASGAAEYLLDKAGGPDPFAVLEPEEFYDFQVRRPRVEMNDGGTRRITWPLTEVYSLEAENLIVGAGEEPNLRWKTYTRSLAQILSEADVQQVVTFGAFIGQVAHTRPVPIIGVATDPALVENLGLISSRYEGPTGIIAVMLEACREVGIPALSLWAATPHYLAANPNPKAMLALLDTAATALDTTLDLADLETAATEFEQKVDDAMADDEDFIGYVRRLENDSGTEPLDPTRSDHLIREIESFLKES